MPKNDLIFDADQREAIRCQSRQHIASLCIYYLCVVIRALLAAHHHCSGAVCQRQGIVGIVANGVCRTVGQGN